MRQLTAALIALLLLPAAVASADPFDDVFADYQADGRVDPCAHTEAELQQAKRDIPNDIDQYAPELPGQLDAAIEQREQGACDPGATTPATTPSTTPTAPSTTEAPPPATTPTTPTTPAQTAPPATTQTTTAAAPGGVAPGGDDDDGAGAALVALAAAGALLLLAAFAWALLRLFAWEPRWLLGARHAVAEAGWRTSGAWADFTDWLRSRRPAS